jgi:3-oxoacyl-[acyl-carrier protein] reductase/(S)-1-phenylethanol dehydrogenase
MGKKHQDRVAVITGAAGGLGQAFAEGMAEAGYHLALTDIIPCDGIAEKAASYGGMVYHETCNLTISEDVHRFAENVLAKYGGVDILVNNAAVMMMKTLDEIELDDFRLFEGVNLEAPLLLSKAFVPGMTKRGWGRIVNMTSSSAWHPHEGFLGYITTKMGIIGMTRYLAVELGGKGITVNALTPSLTRHSGNENTLPGEFFERVAAKQAIPRTAVPEDIVGTLLFLISDDAGFMTGQTLATDGGAVFL